MKFEKVVTKPVLEVFLPSQVYYSKEKIEKLLERDNLEIIGFRQPVEGDLWILSGEGQVSKDDDLKYIYSPKDDRGPARFIVRRKQPVVSTIPLDVAWE